LPLSLKHCAETRVICLIGFLLILVSSALAQFGHTDSTGPCLGTPQSAEGRAANAAGTMYAEARGRDIHLFHTGAVLNCCNQFYVDYQVNGISVVATERDTVADPCMCECTYNVHSILHDLPNGQYIVTLLDWTFDGVPADTVGTDTVFIQFEQVNDDPADNLPAAFRLSQNYPNPTNPSTSIRFSLAYASPVTLELFNISGQRVATIANGRFAAGEHTVTWDGNGLGGRPVSSGIYLYRFAAGEYVATRKMVVLK
jgi:hypothetical protein